MANDNTTYESLPAPVRNTVRPTPTPRRVDTGQMIKYHELLCHLDYRDNWMLSSANEFGHLSNGAG
ncbi:hypothetical protein ACHAWF_004739 [Thalassiosira exigua]